MEKKDWFDKTIDKMYEGKQKYEQFDKNVREQYKRDLKFDAINGTNLAAGQFYPDDNAFSYIANRVVPTVIIIGLVLIYFLGYKPSYIDPIENIKKAYIIFQIISIIVFFCWRLVIEHKNKRKEDVLKKLKILLIVQCVVLLILGVTLLIFDNIYNNNQIFEKFYENISEEEKNKINFASIFGIQETIDSKKAYIDENMKAYSFFQIKALLMVAIYSGCILWNVVRMYRITVMIQKHKEIRTNDDVLYDDKTEVITGGYISFEEYEKMKEKEKNI